MDEIDTRYVLLENAGYAWTVARVELQRDDLVVRLSGLERIAALRREVRVPLACVRRVCADPDPWSALRGVRAPGTGIPGVVAYGVRRLTGDRPDFAAVHGRGPAVRLELAPGAAYGRVVVTDPNVQATVAAIQARVATEPREPDLAAPDA
jgi:hypothetical protein